MSAVPCLYMYHTLFRAAERIARDEAELATMKEERRQKAAQEKLLEGERRKERELRSYRSVAVV